MMANGKETSDKARVFKSGPMEPNTKASGLTTRPKEKASLLTLMETFMMVTGKKIKHQVTGSTFITMEPDTKANG